MFIWSDNLFRVSLQTDLVTGCHLLLIYFIVIMLGCTFSLRKWQSTSICLIHLWKIGFLHMCMADFLSLNNFMGVVTLIHRVKSNCFSHNNSQIVSAMDLYSASALERATTDCCLFFQLTKFPPTRQQKPLVDFLH